MSVEDFLAQSEISRLLNYFENSPAAICYLTNFPIVLGRSRCSFPLISCPSLQQRLSLWHSLLGSLLNSGGNIVPIVSYKFVVSGSLICIKSCENQDLLKSQFATSLSCSKFKSVIIQLVSKTMLRSSSPEGKETARVQIKIMGGFGTLTCDRDLERNALSASVLPNFGHSTVYIGHFFLPCWNLRCS